MYCTTRIFFLSPSIAYTNYNRPSRYDMIM